MNLNSRKTGIWLIGAYGDIATTLIVGLCARRNKLISNAGLVTELPTLQQLNLINLDELVIGGHDVIESTVNEQAEEICNRSRTFTYPLLNEISPQLTEIDQAIVSMPELAWDTLKPPAATEKLTALSEKLRKLIRQFVKNNELNHVVVVNLASAEVQVPVNESHHEMALFETLLEDDRKDLVSPSMLCAYAAFQEHCSYVNFTPNAGAAIGALQDLAQEQKQAYYGNDGKTGETLLKTALAPMFMARNLKIMSWEGTNMLGNGDGRTLNIPENCKTKLENKEAVLPAILGYQPHSHVEINYVPSLGDWKTAWDFIHFQGFLDVPMTMQFTWQGCDSILAAPLVLDMVRLAEFAHEQEEAGPMNHLACFFKNPLGTKEHNFFKQFEMLLAYAAKHLPHQS